MNSKAMFISASVSILTAIMVMFLSAMVLDLRGEVQAFREASVTRKDLVQVRVPEMRLFAEERCTTCHSERRFLTEHESSAELLRHVEQMAALPDVEMSPEEVKKAHASLNVLKCTQCHDTEALKVMAVKSDSERLAVINEMADKPRSMISRDDIEDINKSFERIFGF